MIPPSEWKWYGEPKHFIGCWNCCHHLATQIGPYLVSTIGCYHPGTVVTRTLNNRETIGSGRFYETMVFETNEHGEHSGSHIDFEGYNNPETADQGHMALCLKYAELAS